MIRLKSLNDNLLLKPNSKNQKYIAVTIERYYNFFSRLQAFKIVLDELLEFESDLIKKNTCITDKLKQNKTMSERIFSM